MPLPGWQALETAKAVRNFFEVGALVLFATLVLFEVIAYRSPKGSKREHLFEALGLISFALAVAFECFGYAYIRRVDKLADEEFAAGLKRASPWNQSVSDISGSATINIAGTNGPFVQMPDEAWIELLEDGVQSKTPRTLYLGGFGSLLADAPVPFTHTESGARTYFGYAIDFRTDRRGAPPRNGYVIADKSPITPSLLTNKVTTLMLGVKFIPRDSEILGGSAEILINGAFRKQFVISPQKTDTNLAGWNPTFQGVFLYATSAP